MFCLFDVWVLSKYYMPILTKNLLAQWLQIEVTTIRFEDNEEEDWQKISIWIYEYSISQPSFHSTSFIWFENRWPVSENKLWYFRLTMFWAFKLLFCSSKWGGFWWGNVTRYLDENIIESEAISLVYAWTKDLFIMFFLSISDVL